MLRDNIVGCEFWLRAYFIFMVSDADWAANPNTNDPPQAIVCFSGLIVFPEVLRSTYCVSIQLKPSIVLWQLQLLQLFGSPFFF